MKIAVIGTGFVGGALGTRWSQVGHTVTYGSRDPQAEKVQEVLKAAGSSASATSVAEAVQDAEVVVLAAPWPNAEEVIQAAGDLSGKVLVDCTNPINNTFTGLDLGFTESAAERIATWATGAKVVKAFNTVSAGTMSDADYDGQAANVFYCGDDQDANDIVGGLAREIGLDAIDAGPLEHARYLEPLAMLYIKVAIKHGWGGNCAIKMLTREKKS